jgi:signal transduction histidine kinase
MAQPSKKQKTFLENLFGTNTVELEKKRLEAFLDSVPGAYCGWDRDGGIAWNDAFLQAVGVEDIRDFTHLQNCFEPEDSIVLESAFQSLRENGTAFQNVFALRGSPRFFRISGKRGFNLDEDDHYDVLWLEDVTDTHLKTAGLEERYKHASEELRSTQEICDSAPFPIWFRDETLNLIWCNQAYAKILNTPPAHIITHQQELMGTITSNGKKKEKMEMRRLAETARDKGGVETCTGHMIVAGKRRLFQFQEIPQKKSGGFLGMAHDVTREEELSTEMAHHIAANHALLDQLHSAIAIFNKDQQLDFYNSAFASLWKLEDQYLNTKPKLGDIMEKLREQRTLPEQADFRSFKKSWLDMFTSLMNPFEDMLYLPDETAVRMLVVAHPLGGLMMTFEDVTSRLQLESSYNTLIAVQKETLDNLAEGVSVIGEDGRLKLWNPSFAALWGLHPEDLEGQPHITQLVEKMKPFFDAGFWPEYYNQLLSLGLEREERAGRLSRADDHVIDYATLPLMDGGELVTYTDMTDTVHVEKALRERNAALETAERLKLDFLANVSYQLRTPLNSIMGFTEMLDGEFFGPLNEQQKEYTGNITLASERLLSLVNDILDLSTIEAGYLELQKKDVDIHELLRSLSKLVQEWARNRKIDIHLDCPDTIGMIHADEQRLKQVLLNLLRNAIAFTPDDGSGIITVTAEKDGNRLTVSIRDTGIGIPLEEQERIFQPFERTLNPIDAAPTVTRGAGLGLSIVKNITELHGGDIRLESEPHVGTEVTLTLPIREKLEVRS